MAQPVSLAALVLQVRQQTDTENDDHVTTNEIETWINKGVKRFHGILQKADPDFFLVTVNLTTFPGVLEYDFADGLVFTPTMADFRSIRGVDTEFAGVTRRLRSFPFDERSRRQAYALSTIGLPRYRAARNRESGSGARLLFDIDPGLRRYEVHYNPVPAVIDAANPLDAVMGFDDYVIAYTAMKVRKKSDEPTDEEARDMAQIEAEIKNMGKDRHVDGMERVVVTRVRRRYHLFNDDSFL